MLENYTPTSAISANIGSQTALAKSNVKVEELPSLNSICGCRLWEQLFTYGTGHRQVALQNVVVGIMEDEMLWSLILSSSIILEDETSEKQCEVVFSTIANSGKQLKHWAEILKCMFSQYVHDITGHTSMNIEKLESSEAISSDTCNGSRKICHLLV
eukprot:7487541-Ditylum_brightwellii.AAC.1